MKTYKLFQTNLGKTKILKWDILWVLAKTDYLSRIWIICHILYHLNTQMINCSNYQLIKTSIVRKVSDAYSEVQLLHFIHGI